MKRSHRRSTHWADLKLLWKALYFAHVLLAQQTGKRETFQSTRYCYQQPNNETNPNNLLAFRLNPMGSILQKGANNIFFFFEIQTQPCHSTIKKHKKL